MRFNVEIKIVLKKTVADPQGLTVKHALESLGFGGIGTVRMGKFITVQIEAQDKGQAQDQVQQMCAKLLANPIIEEYSFEVRSIR